MRYDKRETVAPERAALEEEAKRLRAAARYLGEEKRRQHRMMRWVTGAWLSFAVCSAGAVGGWLQATRADVAATAPEAPPAVWASDGADMGDAGTIARPMPSAPFEGQKKPPCNKHLGQVEANGACWLALEVKPSEVPGCGPDYFEHGGKCYLPVRQAKRLPTSVMP